MQDNQKCDVFIHTKAGSVNYTQMTEEERKQYWENYRKMHQDTILDATEGGKFSSRETIY